MCSPVAMGVATGVQAGLGAISQAQQTRAANEQARRDYEYKLAIRKNRWMRELSIYGTKKVQFEKSIDESNIAAQRAYTQSQINYNRIRTQALFDQQTDFKEMLKAEGMIEAQAAERGVRGKSVKRSLDFNLQTMGLANRQRSRALVQNAASLGSKQSMRTRGLTASYYEGRESMENVNRQLKGSLNRSFGKVALQPIQDMAPPKPVMQNVGLTLMVGMGQALGAGIEGMETT